MPDSRSFHKGARLRIVGLYLALGVVWILSSDRLLLLLATDAGQLTWLQTYKGWGFVLLTALLLFVLIGRYQRQDEKWLDALRESERRFRALTEATSDWVWEVDRDGVYTYVSPKVRDLLGYDPDEVVGRTPFDLMPPDEAERIGAEFRAIVQSRRPFTGLENLNRHRDGHCVVLESSGVPVFDAAGTFVGYRGIDRDVTARKQAEEYLEQAAAVYRNSRDGIIITDAQSRIQAVNPAFTVITGYAIEDIAGETPRLLQSGRQDRAFYQQMWAAVEREGGWSGEIWNRRKDGSIYPEWLSISTVRDAAGKATNYVGVFSDLSQLKRSEAELEHLANHDPLTGLPNRRLLHARLEHAIDQAQRHGYGLAILLLDLDRFKDINDSLGLQAGDALLQETARRLAACLRREDTLARISGDELVVVLEEIEGPRQAAEAAEKIRAGLRLPYQIDGHEIFLTASIGISLFPDNGVTPELLIRSADAAVHRAKEESGNRVEFYSESLSCGALERLSLESGLRRAVREGELELHYQPQLFLDSGRLAGLEALVRWRHPEQGLIPPARFIPQAERSDLIVAVGEWVLDEACRQMSAWRQAGLQIPRVAVNLSAQQLGRPDLIEAVTDTLARYCLPAAMLELELTETAIMHNPAEAAESLQALSDLGIALAVDDFGTGYSSLAYLQRLCLHRLKIDRAFVHDLPGNQNAAAICRAIIALAGSLGMEAVAEGIEQEDQHDFLTEATCPVGQGWLFAKAMPPAELEGWLRSRYLPGAG